MFEWQYCLKYDVESPKGPKRDYRKLLAVFLLFTFFSFINLDPVITFARYAVNLQNTLALNTTNFYLTPSLELDPPYEVSFDTEKGFTDGIDIMVANYLGNNITTNDISYTISIFENRDEPLFNLFIDGDTEDKIICSDNSINGTLTGGLKRDNEHRIYLGLQDPSIPNANYSVIVRVVSSEPYVRSYNFPINIKFESSLVLIDGTEDIYRPDVEIPEGEIMVFKDEEYLYLTPEDLINGPVVIDDVVEDRERDDLIGGSLYVPATIGELTIGSNQMIAWDVQGHIVLEPDIVVNSGNTTVSMLSYEGNIILNGVEMNGGSSQAYVVEIVAEKGKIEADGAKIVSKPDNAGKINLVANDDININGAQIESGGNYGVNIKSESGDINGEGANIVSNNGAANAVIDLQAGGLLNLDNATVYGKTVVTIGSLGDITARSANIHNDLWGNNITITSTNGGIDLSALTGTGTGIAAAGNIIITAKEDISIISANISCKNDNMEVSFTSTGSGSTLFVRNAIVKGKPVKAKNLIINGSTASGSITIIP